MMKLTRTSYEESGIYGILSQDDGSQIAVTLEHAYQQDDGSFAPKTPSGIYQCVLGQHELASMTAPFQTYEITNVPGHSNILIHMGNYNADSEGCVLVGANRVDNMITNSRVTFASFMESMAGIDSFQLEIV